MSKPSRRPHSGDLVGYARRILSVPHRPYARRVPACGASHFKAVHYSPCKAFGALGGRFLGIDVSRRQRAGGSAVSGDDYVCAPPRMPWVRFPRPRHSRTDEVRKRFSQVAVYGARTPSPAILPSSDRTRAH